MNNYLYFQIVYVFAEGVIFLVAMQRIKDFKEDFNLFSEVRIYSLNWLVFTNVILFLTI